LEKKTSETKGSKALEASHVRPKCGKTSIKKKKHITCQRGSEYVRQLVKTKVRIRRKGTPGRPVNVPKIRGEEAGKVRKERTTWEFQKKKDAAISNSGKQGGGWGKGCVKQTKWSYSECKLLRLYIWEKQWG